MKTYVITVSRQFPTSHKRKGEPTYFVENIPEKKRHTIRQNYELWKKRFERIHAGEACISLRYWSDKPYKSKQVEFKRLYKEDGIGIEKLGWGDFGIHIDGKGYGSDSLSSCVELATNDGLTIADMESWFMKAYQPLVIIHFTNFRYNTNYEKN